MANFDHVSTKSEMTESWPIPIMRSGSYFFWKLKIKEGIFNIKKIDKPEIALPLYSCRHQAQKYGSYF